jgi:hypothetical protein
MARAQRLTQVVTERLGVDVLVRGVPASVIEDRER